MRDDRLRIPISVELRATPAGVIRHAASSDHYINVHAGEPVRVACHANTVRSIRARGDVSLLPAGTSDEWVEDDEAHAVVLRLPSSLVRIAAQDMGMDPDHVSIEPLHHVRDPQIEHIAWALEAERRADNENGQLYRESLGMALAVHLLARYRRVQRPRSGLAREQLQRVTEYIEANVDRDLSLLRLARVAGVSASHFKTLFKRSMGVAAHEYVIQRRVERARSLLVESELPASQVALEAGFSHQSHMARCMRRVLGVTPASVVRARA
ncbi:MAG: helix-turn-helix transcriptional regulator [Polyangiaceae bacterium]|nr:helix-turn-helix transcriptional regulator [Polyangiaceae bacterium]